MLVHHIFLRPFILDLLFVQHQIPALERNQRGTLELGVVEYVIIEYSSMNFRVTIYFAKEG